MIKKKDISIFSLDILNDRMRSQFSGIAPDGDAFRQLCFDLLGRHFEESQPPIRLSMITTSKRSGHSCICGEDGRRYKYIVECKKNDSPLLAEKSLMLLSKKLEKNLCNESGITEAFTPWFDKKLKGFIYCVSCSFEDESQRTDLRQSIREMLLELAVIPGLTHLKTVSKNIDIYDWNQLALFLSQYPDLYSRWIESEPAPAPKPTKRTTKTATPSPLTPEKSLSPLPSPPSVSVPSSSSALSPSKPASRASSKSSATSATSTPSSFPLKPEITAKAFEKSSPLAVRESETRPVSIPGKTPMPDSTQDLGQTGIPGLKRIVRILPNEHPLRYGDYLFNARLDYISRSEFKQKHPEVPDLATEEDILETMLEWGIYEGAILYGEGGIGKTRLMLEIGFIAEKDDWQVYLITKKLSNLDLLKPILKDGVKYLFLCDHIEENPLFDTGIVKRLKQLSPGAAIRVIGCCRKTYMDTSDLFEADNFLKWNLSIKDKYWERRYKNYVVETILGPLRSLFPAEKDFNELRPAFAVFLKYLNEKNQATEEDLALQSQGSFRMWLKKRLRMTFAADSYSELALRQERFYIFCILPSSPQLTNSLLDSYADVLLPLKKDGWIETDEHQQLRVLHDTITEEIVMLRLQESRDFIESEIERIFNFAVSYNSLENCFKLFNRIADFIHELFKDKPNGKWTLSHLFHNLLSKYVESKPEVCTKIKGLLIKTPLIDEIDVVSLLTRHYPYFEPVIQEIAFGLKLSFILKHFYKNWSNYKQTDIEDIKGSIRLLLNGWLAVNADFMEHRYISARLIAAFSMFFGFECIFHQDQPISSYAEKWMDSYPLELDTSFVIQSWLDGGGSTQAIEKYVKGWLQKYPLEMETSFVIQSWLDVGGNEQIVQDYVTPWLQKYPLEMESSFVIKSWLTSGGDPLLIKRFVTPWLQKFPTEFETRFVIKSWLASGGNRDSVQEYVLLWLNRFPLETETSFVIQSWLDSGGDLSVIKDNVIAWLKKNMLTGETSFVIKSWLDAGGDSESIKSFVAPWLEGHLLEFDTSFVIQAWLAHKGDNSIIKPFLTPWLERYASEMETSFVIKAWLDAGGDIESISNYIKPWLARYPLVMESSFVMKSWLDSGGSKELIEEFFVPWLNKYPLEMETHFVMKAWLDAGGRKEVVASFVRPWLEKFPLQFKTSFVIQAWLDAGGNREMVEDFVIPWLDKYATSFETSFVINAWLDSGGATDQVKKYISTWLERFKDQRESGYVIQAWLAAGGDTSIIIEHMYPWLEKHPLETETGFIIQSWLDKGGNPLIVEKYIAPWLQKHPVQIETGFLMQSWLTAGGSKDLVKDYLTHWLQRFPLSEDRTSFVIKSWLNAGGEADIVKSFVIDWLEKFRHTFESTYVIKAWIKNTNDTDTVKKYAHDWILVFKDHPDADFVIKRFCRFKDISPDVLDAAIYWCQKYADNSEALFTISYLTRYHIANPIMSGQWLIDLLIQWIDRPNLDKIDLINLESIMFNTTRDNAFCYSENSIRLSVHWFLSPHSFLPVTLDYKFNFMHQWWYFLKYSKLISDGKIDCAKHREYVGKFLKWVNGWDIESKKKIKRNIDILRKMLPQFNDLWSLVHE